MKAAPGTVYLVGAGPGDPGLITVRGRALLETADVVVFDRLIEPELLGYAPPTAELIDVGKKPSEHAVSQTAIEVILVERARRGGRVVRLKGGDPFVFGRGFEEMRACREAGIPCIVVPGITSAIAGPAAAGIPVTLRGLARSFAVVTAGVAPGSPDVDFASFTDVDTVVVLMGGARLAEVAEAMILAGRARSTPAACIERATTPRQRVVRATLDSIAAAAGRDGLSAPMIIVVGEVVGEAMEGSLSAMTTPLGGKRVLVTKSGARSSAVMRSLRVAGAIPIAMPLIQIEYTQPARATDRIASLASYDWIVFTSIHGVRGFWRILDTAGRDARVLGACKVAAVGSATANELRKCGIRADLVPAEYTGVSLAHALLQTGAGEGTKMLFPRGNIGGVDITEGLRDCGVEVDEYIVYSTAGATPSLASLERMPLGVDAILFFSPSAVRRFASLGLKPGRAVVACIGPTSAKAAAECGIDVGVVPSEHTMPALLVALEDFFQVAAVAS